MTLTGPSGTGKTRLALEAAAGLRASFPDGVWWIELARLADPAFVASSIAAALDLKGVPGRPISALLFDFMRTRRLLLLLDNCKHLIQACAELAEALLRSCPRLSILATSREGLGITGETSYPVGSLSLPRPKQTPTVAALSQSDTIQLFVHRCWNSIGCWRARYCQSSGCNRVTEPMGAINVVTFPWTNPQCGSAHSRSAGRPKATRTKWAGQSISRRPAQPS